MEQRRLLAVVDLASVLASEGSTFYGAETGDQAGVFVTAIGDMNLAEPRYPVRSIWAILDPWASRSSAPLRRIMRSEEPKGETATVTGLRISSSRHDGPTRSAIFARKPERPTSSLAARPCRRPSIGGIPSASVLTIYGAEVGDSSGLCWFSGNWKSTDGLKRSLMASFAS